MYIFHFFLFNNTGAKNIFPDTSKLSNEYEHKHLFLPHKASDTYSTCSSQPHKRMQTHTFSHTQAYAYRHSHTVSLLAQRKGGREDEKEEAEVLKCDWVSVCAKHVWKYIQWGSWCMCDRLCMYWHLWFLL